MDQRSCKHFGSGVNHKIPDVRPFGRKVALSKVLGRVSWCAKHEFPSLQCGPSCPDFEPRDQGLIEDLSLIP